MDLEATREKEWTHRKSPLKVKTIPSGTIKTASPADGAPDRKGKAQAQSLEALSLMESPCFLLPASHLLLIAIEMLH